MHCPSPHFYNVVIAIGMAAHSATLFFDYWLGKAEHIESNSLVELVIKLIKSLIKKKIDEIDLDLLKEKEKEEKDGKQDHK